MVTIGIQRVTMIAEAAERHIRPFYAGTRGELRVDSEIQPVPCHHHAPGN